MKVSFPLKAVAACFSLSCFGVAMVSGLIADRSASSILASSLIAMFVGQFVGGIAASILADVMGQGIRDYQRTHPVPAPFNPARSAGGVEEQPPAPAARA